MAVKERIKILLANNVVKAGSWNTIANFLIRGIGYISVPIFVRIMTTTDYGLYNTFLSYITIFSCIIGIGQNGLQQTAKYDMHEKYNSFLLTGVVMSFIITGIMTVLFVILAQFGLLGNEFTFFDYALMLICAFFSSVITVYSSKLSVFFQYKPNIVISFFCSVFTVALGIIFIYSGLFSTTFLARSISLTLIYALISICIVIVIIRNIVKNKERLAFGQSSVYILRLGSPLILHLLANSVLAQFDRIMIMNEAGAEKTAIYSFIYTFGILLLTIWTSIEPTWAAWEMQELTKEKYDKIRKYSLVAFLAVTYMACFLILFAPELVCFIGTKDYLEGVSLIYPIVLSVLLIMMTNFYTQIEYYRRKMSLMSMGTVGAAVINVVLNYICIEKFGYQAAAYTTLVSYAVMLLFHVYIAHKLIDIKQVYNEKALWACLACGALVSIVANTFNAILFMRGIVFIGCTIVFAFWVMRQFGNKGRQ